MLFISYRLRKKMTDSKIYTVSCSVRDCPLYSGIIGLYSTKKSAVENLIKKAGYTVSEENRLLRHSKPVEWQSYEDLYNNVHENSQLIDIDDNKMMHIYTLTEFSGVQQ